MEVMTRPSPCGTTYQASASPSPRRRSSLLLRMAYSSSNTSSSPDQSTPDTDNQTDVDGYNTANTPFTDILNAPKIEELDLNSPDDLKDIEPSTALTAPKKRGRPRKEPFIGPQKASHARSKTGCGTCRRRKKKCDETKPSCTNCEKNNYVCTGYEPKQLWRGGRVKAPMTKSLNLPPLVKGMGGSNVSNYFWTYFMERLSNCLSLTDNYNPFRTIIFEGALQHKGLLHSVLFLSGSSLTATSKETNPAWEICQTQHGIQAFNSLFEDIGKATAAEGQESSEAMQSYGDSSIAQALVLCLQTVCAGDLTGSYRTHLDAMKRMLTETSYTFSDPTFRTFILEFLLYHDFSSSITSLTNPLDARSLTLMRSFHETSSSDASSSSGNLLGVLDGLFDLLARIRSLRDTIRALRGVQGRQWHDFDVSQKAFAIDTALRHWTCSHTPDNPRYAASLLYRQCIWIYLYRTFQPSIPSPVFTEAVDQGLSYLKDLPEEMQSILLMPLFLLGCAAWDEGQRREIEKALERLEKWSQLGNIRYAREVIREVWVRMDRGDEEGSWDWEDVLGAKGWDFLVT
ncbi:C6 transcription factor OefC like protein [Zymoseptoria brevis]|uniref:C6 transcription factor OefC like protein n=1 Tax=Zymoseptoria brevis TaxID=1047168 RepID=A0A0F4GKY7_9PEZI|nr:C6 transcription factor OefC like protein [Zymoseptoria brevis]